MGNCNSPGGSGATSKEEAEAGGGSGAAATAAAAAAGRGSATTTGEAKDVVETPMASTAGASSDAGKPRVIELYEFGKQLGSGAYSTVFQSTSKADGTTVAIKKITKKNLQPHDHKALEHEVAILRDSKGAPHILQYLDFFEEERYYYLVTEEVSGGELFDRICQKVVYTEHEARELVRILLGTLAFLHNSQIAHRDLKPENLLLKSREDDSNIILADFGFATKCKGKNLNQVCGTPDYVAPEIISHLLYDYSCDVWSAGVITYILLGGYPPFQSRTDDRDELFKIIKRGKVRFHDEYWSDISPEAKDMIRSMLTVDVTQRPTANALLRCEWMGRPEATLKASNLEQSRVRLKEFNAKRKLKGAVHAIKAATLLQKTVSALAIKRKSQEAMASAAAAAADVGEPAAAADGASPPEPSDGASPPAPVGGAEGPTSEVSDA